MSDIISTDPEFINLTETGTTWRIILSGFGSLLSFLVGVSLNVHILRRLLSKDVKKMHYFRLQIFNSCLDIYLAVYELISYMPALIVRF